MQTASILDDIISNLGKLDRVSLAEVEKRAAFLKQMGGVGSSDPLDSTSGTLLSVIIEVLRPKHIATHAASRFKDSSGREAFDRKARAFSEFLIRQGLDKVGRQVVMKTAVVLLVSRMEDEGQSVSFNSVVGQAHRLVSELNREFPGYASAGLLKLLVRK